MRILYLNASGVLGGAERSLLDIFASLRQAQPTWELCLLVARDGPLLARAKELGVTCTVLPFPPALSRIGETGSGRQQLLARVFAAVWPAARYVGQLRRAVERIGPHVVHSNSLKMHVLGAWALRRIRPLVWHLHDYVGRRALTARLLRWSTRACVVAVANSESVAADARRALGAGVDVVSVLNAVDLERFSPCGHRADLDRLSGLPPAADGVVRVGLVGTFGRWKGQTTFLDALSRVSSDVSIRGYVIGDALYDTEDSQWSREDLERHAQRVGLAGQVGFTGFVAESDAAIRALDIVVHASTEPEPFGLVIAEAMACGRAVIVSDAGGARELFTPGVNAVAHRPGDADGLAERITELARDADARAGLGRAGRQTAERQFDRARLGRQLVPVYEQAVAGA